MFFCLYLKYTKVVDYLQTQNEIILGLLSINLVYILVVWKFGAK